MSKVTRRSFLKTTATLSALPLMAQASTTSASTKPGLKFMHVTDSHMDLDISESVESVKLMVKFINEKYKDLDFVLFGGDNFNNNAKEGEDALLFKSILSKLHCPAYLVRGNKESTPLDEKDGYGINYAKFKSLFLSDVKMHGKDWLVEKNGYNILGLDSCIDNQGNGLYTEETLAFAEKILKEAKPTLILNHHPYTNYWHGTDKKDIHKYVLGNTKEAQKRLFHYDNLLLTLSGHKHIDSVLQIDKAKVIVTRGFKRPLDKNQYPMRYIALNGNNIEEKLIYTA